MTERGRCVIYDKDLIDQYNELSRKERKNDISKSIYSPETDYSPDFKKHHPVLWEKYLNKVQGKVDSSLLELLQSADETVYSQSKVSRLCKVTKRTVAEWCEVGIGNKILKHTVSPFNNRVYIKAEDLKEWIDYVQSYKKEQDKLPKINI
jgi:hypothetical protein